MSFQIQIPLLHDHHSHPLFYAAFEQGVSLESVIDKPDAQAQLARGFEKSDGLTVAYGWRSNCFDWSPAELESMPPLAMFNVSLHSLLINRAGMQILMDRYGDVVHQLENRQWYEANLRVVLNWFANLSASVENLQAFYAQLLLQGVYSVEEMLLVDENEINIFDQAALMDRTTFWAAPDTFESLSATAKARVDGLKLFTDGAIGSRTAAMNRPYRGQSSAGHGMLIYRDDELAQALSGCFDTGKSLAIHAIGDRAIEQVIGLLGDHRDSSPRPAKIRIEHVQMISPSLARRAKELGLILSMQPNFNSDSVDYSDRLDSEYCLQNNPFRMLIDDVGFVVGQDLILGSDGMPHGIESAVNQAFFPPVAGQRLTPDEFVAGYCLHDLAQGSIQLDIDESKQTVRCLIDRASPNG